MEAVATCVLLAAAEQLARRLTLGSPTGGYAGVLPLRGHPAVTQGGAMSDQPGTESFEDDLGSISIDDATDSGSGQEELLDASEGDNEPWSPPDSQPRNTEWGTTAWEQGQEETIDQRIMQEVPGPGLGLRRARQRVRPRRDPRDRRRRPRQHRRRPGLPR